MGGEQERERPGMENDVETDPLRADRRKFLTALGFGAGAVAAAGGGIVRAIAGAVPDAAGESVSGAAPPAAAGAAASAANADYGRLTRRLARMSRVTLPQGFKAQNLTDEDVARIADLAARGVPARATARMNGQNVLADEPCNGTHHRNGENCTGVLFLCQGDFSCTGGWWDDFECYAGTPGMSGFSCSLTFNCIYSFDQLEDCPGAGNGSGMFSCPNNFHAEGCQTGYIPGEGGGGGGGGPTGSLDSGFSSVRV